MPSTPDDRLRELIAHVVEAIQSSPDVHGKSLHELTIALGTQYEMVLLDLNVRFPDEPSHETEAMEAMFAVAFNYGFRAGERARELGWEFR